MEASYREFLEETANSLCTNACEFNNRANAMMELGRYLEAQRDYNRACNLEPDEPIFFHNRAELFIQLGMIYNALQDAIHIRHIIRSSSMEQMDNLFNLFYLVELFLKCYKPDLAAETLLDFLRLLKFLTPCISKEDDGGYIIRQNNRTIHTNSIISYDEIIALLLKIQNTDKYSDNQRLQALVGNIKKLIIDIKENPLVQ